MPTKWDVIGNKGAFDSNGKPTDALNAFKN